MPTPPPRNRRGSRGPSQTPREGEEYLDAGGRVDPDSIRRAQLSKTPAEGAEPTSDEPIAPSDDDAPNRVVFSLLKDLDKRLDKYLTDRIPFMSRSQLQRLIDEGGVLVNAKKPKASTLLHKGDLVEVFVPPPPSSEVGPEDIPLQVLYEDAHLIVLNKTPDIIVHPARSHNSGTMINALAYHFQHRSSLGGALSGVGKEFARPGVVHRLDRHTSGVIVFAKDDHAHWKMGQQFERRTVEKRYLAVVHGHVVPPIDVIDLPLGPHPSKEKGYREKYVVRHDELGKASVTICRVLAHFGPAWPGETGKVPPPVTELAAYSLVELELKTGRTHQIRVHLSHLGYPIVADDMYGGKIPAFARDAEPVITRHALHASLLSFRHPVSGEAMTFTAPFPTDMASLVAHLRTLAPGPRPFSPPGTMLHEWAAKLLEG
jgi:23S rRNA pseudouridine1911/1915/1917 synthase